MRTRLAAIAACVCLAAPAFAYPGLAAGAGFDSALRAYERGDKTRAFLEWKAEADKGDPASQWLVGNMYAKGEGMDAPQPDRAAQYYRDAAEQGYAEAQVSLATLYRLGYGVAQDYKSALAWLYEAASKKHPVAQMDLGDLFLTGVPGQVERNTAQALQWYLMAAQEDVIVAEFKAGQLYLENTGIEPDPVAGLGWMYLAYRAAAKGQEGTRSRRVMALSQKVEKDRAGRTLGEVIMATYLDYRKRYPARVVERAERLAREGQLAGAH